MSTPRTLPASLVVALLLSAGLAHAQSVTTTHSTRGTSLYYALGGSFPAARAPNPAALRYNLGLSGAAGLNYSCGKFDARVSLQNTVNKLKDLDKDIKEAMEAAVGAAISALPMYILQRAQPGWYEIIQSYIQKARELVNLSFQSCEQLEQGMARNGYSYYDQYVSQAMGETWKTEANESQDAVAAKEKVQKTGGDEGVTAADGEKKGGKSQKPISIVSDLVGAGYNLTMGKGATSDFGTSFPPTSRLTKAFAKPQEAVDYAIDVVGDIKIGTCDDEPCPDKATHTANGLNKKFEDEITTARTHLTTAFTAVVPSSTMLEAASAPGVLITRDLVDAVRSLPKSEQAIAFERLAQEIALARTVDRALLVRQMMLTGSSLPNAQTETYITPTTKKLAEIDKAIDGLMYEVRIRKELVSTSASTLVQYHQAQKAASSALPSTSPADKHPFINGRPE